MNKDFNTRSAVEPLLLEGYALKEKCGRTSLCIGSRLKSLRAPQVSNEKYARLDAPSIPVYEYKMFDEGMISYIDSDDVVEMLSGGARIVITEI
tara:strand:- start:1478 stop:1759 length:282 start_codon:yes stop_codon:yes gene_type:complete